MEIVVDGKSVEAKKGETILTVLKREGVVIPTLCYKEGLSPTGACRLCVVEVEGARSLVPSCAYPVNEGMKILTSTPRVLNARKTIIELLLADHPHDCFYCGRNQTCELREYADQFGIKNQRFTSKKKREKIDISSPSIVRDPNKCILCGRCVRVCEEVQAVGAIDFVGRGSKTVVGTAFNEGLNISSCVNCGQCIVACPTGALAEKNSVLEVIAALNDPKKHVVVQHAPAVSVTLGEEFGFKPGTDVDGLMTAALRKIGFKRVFDTSFTADVTIMEEASEFIDRVTNKKPLPMFTSCSPAWVKYVETFYPEFLPNVSTCKSPQQMLGALIKSYYAEKEAIDPASIYSVSIMPCTAKKFEIGREDMDQNEISDIDAVLTTRELAQLIRMFGIQLDQLTPSTPDLPFGERSSAGKLFGATGGVMEAALRTAYFMLTQKELELTEIKEIRQLDGIKEMSLDINGLTIGIAVASGLGNARKLLEQIKNGRTDLHFIEIMSCPGGCIAGGGQPHKTDLDKVRKRMKSLYEIDGKAPIRVSHKNTNVQKLYQDYLEKPLSKKSHKLLHTHYTAREVVH